MVVLSLVEQVASDSSKSERVKLQKHISRIASAMPFFSKSWVSFWKMLYASVNQHAGINIAEWYTELCTYIQAITLTGGLETQDNLQFT